MKRLAKKLIKKYKKELNLQKWDIDIEFSPKVRTSIYLQKPNKIALLLLNSAKIKTERKLGRAIKYQIIKLKEKILSK